MIRKFNSMEEELLQRIRILLRRAIALERSMGGNVQIYRQEDQSLVLVAQEGFKDGFLEHFKITKAFDSSACGRAIGIGSPVLISDVESDIGFKKHRKIAKAAGFRAVKSVPILSRGGKRLGVISNHYAEPKWKWETDRLDDIVPELSKALEKLSEAGNRTPKGHFSN
jgi:GAF domain-containing protein